jgi:hypothetical protein
MAAISTGSTSARIAFPLGPAWMGTVWVDVGDVPTVE